MGGIVSGIGDMFKDPAGKLISTVKPSTYMGGDGVSFMDAQKSLVSGQNFGAPDPLDIWGFQADEAGDAAEEAAAAQEAAALSAADIQAQSAREALGETRRQFDITEARQKPWVQAGQTALAKQEALTGLGGRAAQEQAYAQYAGSPGQQFLKDRGQQALLNTASARGGLSGGNVMRALQEQGIGLAQQDYGNYYNRLAGISGTGQTTGAQLGQLGAQQAGQASNLINMAGQAGASGLLGSAQARSSGLLQQQQMAAQAQQNQMGMLSTLGGAAMMAFSDVDLKHNISKFTEKDLKCCYDKVINLPLKHWEYKPETGLPSGKYIGQMYQDSPQCIKVDNKEVRALDIHKECMLIAGALQYLEKQNGSAA